MEREARREAGAVVGAHGMFTWANFGMCRGSGGFGALGGLCGG